MLQGKFDYVKLILHGQAHEGYLVDVSDGVGTLVEMNCNTAFQLSAVLASIEIIDRGEKSFLPRLMTRQQLRARLFILSAKQGVKWGLDYIDYLERESTIPLWVYCCGSEMQLRNQLPSRAESLERTHGETAQMAADRKHIEELARDGDPFFNPLGMTTQEQAQARNATTQCADGSWW